MKKNFEPWTVVFYMVMGTLIGAIVLVFSSMVWMLVSSLRRSRRWAS